jgi:hypothetical protein
MEDVIKFRLDDKGTFPNSMSRKKIDRRVIFKPILGQDSRVRVKVLRDGPRINSDNEIIVVQRRKSEAWSSSMRLLLRKVDNKMNKSSVKDSLKS